MSYAALDSTFLVAGQLTAADLPALPAQGIKVLLCLRPDDEEGEYAASNALRAEAEALGLEFVAAPIRGLDINAAALSALADLEGRFGEGDTPEVLAYCRSGRRVAVAWAHLKRGQGLSVDAILAQAQGAGHDLTPVAEALAALAPVAAAPAVVERTPEAFDVVIVGGGSAGLGTAASLMKRRNNLSIAVVEPSEAHHYQPGLTLVGTGHFDPTKITRREADLIPDGVTWVKGAAATFKPESNEVHLEDGCVLSYRALVVAPGLTLDWDGIDGAREALGKNGVCCNYSPEHAPYTWNQIQSLRSGRALFTQPAMPIKCAGAPQKALYLACDRWRKAGVLKDINVQFHNAGGVLFGVAHFVPTLEGYMKRYGAELCFSSTLTAVDGQAKVAQFKNVQADGSVEMQEVSFDFLHFVPPQRAPAFIAESPLADEAGWLAVDPETLAHPKYGNVFGAGDVVGTSNAKTMAAARKHAPTVAENLLAALDGRPLPMAYDGYGACPLTVEAGRVVLAEFGYGGKLLPTFPIEPAVPRLSQWILKRHLMPYIYWDLMLKGHELFAQPDRRIA